MMRELLCVLFQAAYNATLPTVLKSSEIIVNLTFYLSSRIFTARIMF